VRSPDGQDDAGQGEHPPTGPSALATTQGLAGKKC